MTRKEATKQTTQTTEAKVYPMFDGWLFMENEVDMGANYVIPAGVEGMKIDEEMNKLIPRLGEWVLTRMQWMSENMPSVDDGREFGWKLKLSVEPIFTDDYLLSTKLENQE